MHRLDDIFLQFL